MSDDLEVILSYTEHHDPQIRALLQPPLDPALIVASDIAPLVFPASVHALYAWHNGVQDETGDEQHPLFYYHHFLSFEAAMREYHALMQVNHDIGQIGYRTDLFPVFSFMGEYYMIHCDPADPDYGSIWFVYHGEYKVYDALSTMMTVIRACYEAGAYRVEAGRVIVDHDHVARIQSSKISGSM